MSSKLLSQLRLAYSIVYACLWAHYSTFDRELLAVYLSIRHFRYIFEGRHFHMLTDYKPLMYTLDARLDHHSPSGL